MHDGSDYEQHAEPEEHHGPVVRERIGEQVGSADGEEQRSEFH
jgi:hypothetical protein